MPENPKNQDLVAITPKVAVTLDTPAYYVNFIEVGNTAYDFSLNVARLGSTLTENQLEQVKKGEPFLVDATLQIILPPAVAEGLIKALGIQLERYRIQLAAMAEQEAKIVKDRT